MKPNPLTILIAAVLVVCAWGCGRVEGEGPGYGDLPADRIEVLTRGPVVGPTEVRPVTPAPHIITPPPHVVRPSEHVVTPPPALIKPEMPRVQTKEPVEFKPHTTRLPPSPVVGPRMDTLRKDLQPPPVPAAPEPNPEIRLRSSTPMTPREEHR